MKITKSPILLLCLAGVANGTLMGWLFGLPVPTIVLADVLIGLGLLLIWTYPS